MIINDITLAEGRVVDDLPWSSITTQVPNGPAEWVAGADGTYNDLHIPFTTDPTPAEQDKIRRWLEVPNDNEAILCERAESAMANLRLIINSTGNIPEPQLSNALRLLARNQLALARLVTRRLDALD